MQMASTKRLKRSFIYAALAVIVSTALLLIVAFLGSASLGNAGTSTIDIVSYVFGFPLLSGWLVSLTMFGMPGSCATSTQILGVFLIPFISVPIDAGLIFLVWEFFHRKRSRGLDADRILHING